MEEYVIKETSVWGDKYRARSPNGILRCLEKNKILQEYPFIEHYKIYSFKPSNQRGPTRESQTFIVSYPYNYDSFIGNKEIDFINKLTSIDLRFYKEKCLFKNKDAYRILVLDTDVDLNLVLNLIN